MTAPDTPSLLSSWKEIAAFFGRDVRTVQRWEHEGLPVHRRPGAGRSGVFAYIGELEAWLHGRASTHASQPVAPHPPPADVPPRPPGGRWPTKTFAALAVSLVATVLALSWVAAAGASRRRHTDSAAIASSSEYLDTPRWGDVDGDDRPDLVVNAHESSTVLLFLHANARRCAEDARSCADVRVTPTDACILHSSQVSDLNGDGIDDVAVSCYLSEPASHTRTGPVFLLWGRRSWARNIELPRDADVTIDAGARHDDRMHTCLAAQGRPDLNGDGLADLLLGAVEAPFRDRVSSGTLYVFFGRRHWSSSLRTSHADVAIRGSRTGEGLGGGCATGDFNGDGRQDLAIRADERRLWNLLGGAGRTYLIENPGTWPADIDLAHAPSMRIDAPTPGVESHQVALADLDGDGRSELAISAPRRTGEPSYRGIVGIWRGRDILTGVHSLKDADVIVEGSPGGGLGTAFAAADFDGDGVNEFIVSESRRGALLSVRVMGWMQRQIGSGVMPFVRFAPSAADDLGEGAFAIHGDHIAHVSRSDGGRWQFTLRAAFAPIAIDVRPHFDDDVILTPGVAVVGVARGQAWPEPEIDTLRANGARAFAHTVEDFNGDGTPDVLVYFRTEEMRLRGEQVTLTVTGRTRDGGYVRGSAPVRVVPVAEGR